MSWKDKTILLIGGTGSFGNNFIRCFLKRHTPKRIRIFSRDEYKQSVLLNNSYYGDMLDGFIGDVREPHRLRRAMEGVDVVIHAAALKQVQSCEYNPFETIKTNILGSMNVINAALDAGVEKVLAISTDKAVSPLNLYGATKMCMEKVITNANSYRGQKRTKLCCTRYGNVANSRGSVIPYWQECIRKGKPIPITNSKATRFWLDMDVAIDFVVECLEMMDTLSGGEVFVPKLPSVNIMELYRAVSGGSDFTIIGDRMGDKLHETLVSKDEMKHTRARKDKFIITPENPKWEYHEPEGDLCETRNAYSSDNNDIFLSASTIRERLEQNL